MSDPTQGGWFAAQLRSALPAAFGEVADATRVTSRRPAVPLPPPLPSNTIGPLLDRNRGQAALPIAKQPGVEYVHGDMRDILTQQGGGAGVLDFTPLWLPRAAARVVESARDGHPIRAGIEAGLAAFPLLEHIPIANPAVKLAAGRVRGLLLE